MTKDDRARLEELSCERTLVWLYLFHPQFECAYSEAVRHFLRYNAIERELVALRAKNEENT